VRVSSRTASAVSAFSADGGSTPAKLRNDALLIRNRLGHRRPSHRGFDFLQPGVASTERHPVEQHHPPRTKLTTTYPRRLPSDNVTMAAETPAVEDGLIDQVTEYVR